MSPRAHVYSLYWVQQCGQYDKIHRSKIFAFQSKLFDASLTIIYVQMHLSVDPDHCLCKVDFEYLFSVCSEAVMAGRVQSITK